MNPPAPATTEGAVATTTTLAPHELPDFDPMKAALDADGESSTPATPPPADTKPNPETAKPGEQGTPDGKAKDPKQDPTASDTAKPGEQGTDSAFTKAQKERARQENLLKNFEREKEAFRQEKQSMAATIEGMKRELQQLKQRHAGPPKDEHGIDADTYEELAAKYREQGDDKMARAALERADRLRRQAPAATPDAHPQAEAWQTPEFQAEWSRIEGEIVKARPELADPQHPFFKATDSLLKDPTWGAFFRARPDGLRAAVEVAGLLQERARADALKTQLDQAQAEVARLNKLTQPRGGNPAAASSSERKAVGEMNLDDVMEAARAADQGGG